jgi:drug/metabolite transporter (DMT)-like permease
MSLWYYGAVLSVLGSVASNLGVNIQKYSFMQNEQKSLSNRKKYHSDPKWWLGLTMVIFGSLGDFAALGLAAQSIVAPIGSITLVANVFFAHYWLKESITWKELVGTGLIITGSVLSVAFGDHKNDNYTIDDLKSFYGGTTFIFYAFFALIMGLCMYAYCRLATPIKTKLIESYTRYSAAELIENTEEMENENLLIQQLEFEYSKFEKVHPFCLCALSGVFGGQSVMFGKMVAELISTSFQGNIQILNIWFPLFIVLMGVAVFCQLHFLAVALNFFDALYCGKFSC